MEIKFPGVQLADEYKTWPAGCIEMAVEPKLDGYRLTAMVGVDTVTFHCRNVEPAPWGVNLGHIAKEILALGFRNCMLDGEVMADDWNSTGIIRRKTLSVEQRELLERTVKFYAFDLVDLTKLEQRKFSRTVRTVDPTPKSDRRAALAKFFHGAKTTSVKLTELFIVETEEELKSVAARLVSEGYEGAMAKLYDAPYIMDRSSNWLKIKPTKTVDMEIVGMVEGTGKYVGMLGAIQCRDKAGVAVSVGTGLVDAQRVDLWTRREELVGKVVEVKMQDADSFTATARHPVFVRLREDRTSL